jgi:hypothetical protein
MPLDDEPTEQTIVVREGEISRMYVVMCNKCRFTFTNSVPALNIMEQDIQSAGWIKYCADNRWYCPKCAED